MLVGLNFLGAGNYIAVPFVFVPESKRNASCGRRLGIVQLRSYHEMRLHVLMQHIYFTFVFCKDLVKVRVDFLWFLHILV